MKKYKSALIKFQTHIPRQGELKTRAARIKKDTQVLIWLMESKQGRELIKLSRVVLGLPLDGINPSEDTFTNFSNISNYPKNSQYQDFTILKLRQLVKQISRLCSLSDRFYDSVESFLIFGRYLTELPPAVQASVVIPDFNKPRKEIWIRVYPEATFKDDFRAYWNLVVLAQLELNVQKHASAWKILSQGKDDSTEIYVQVYKETVLEDLNNSTFKTELKEAFKLAGLVRAKPRAWDYKKALKLMELDTITDSDWDKAEQLFGDEKERNSVRKLRQRTLKKL